MDQLKRKSTQTSNEPDPFRRVRPRLSESGISPGQLRHVLEFFHSSNITVSNFLATLLSVDYGDGAGSILHQSAVEDLSSNISAILLAFLSHTRLAGDVLTWALKTATMVYKREVCQLTGKDVGWHFTASRASADQFSDFDMGHVLQDTAARTPLLWDLLEHLFSAEGDVVSTKSTYEEIQFGRNIKKFACIANMAHANNQQCNMLQVIIGIFFHTCNVPERALDLLFHLGLCCSQKTVLSALDSLSKESVDHVKKAGQTLLVAYAYDNFDMSDKSKTPTVEQSSDTLRHLTSGTLLPLQCAALPDLKFTSHLWETSRFNDMKVINPPRRTIHDLFTLHKEDLDSRKQDSHDRFNSWKFLNDLCTHGPSYFKKFSSKIKPPEFIEKVPLFKTHQVPARAMDLPNSKVDGNISTIENLLQQGGVFHIAQLAKEHPEITDPEDYVILFHGDLGTGDRIQTAQIRRSLESSHRLRLSNIIFVPGLFHIKMACADGLWRIFIQPESAKKDETSFFSFLSTLRPNETSKIFNGTAGYQTLNECITHFGRVERLGWWEKIVQETNPSCKTLEDFALREPTLEQLEELSIKLSMAYASKANVKGAGNSSGMQDEQYANTLLRTQYFLLYEETAHAIRSGDVGRVELCLREWIPIFKGVGKHKYAAMLLQFLTDVHFVYPPPLRKTVRYNWFCNISGKELKYQGQDWLVELNNMLTKGIYGGHGSNNTVERVLKESVLIQLFRDIIVIIEKQFGVNPKLTRHGEADMTATYDELLRRMRENCVFTFKNGRTSAHVIRNPFVEGIHKFVTETVSQTADIISNSNETELTATDDDVISESD